MTALAWAAVVVGGVWAVTTGLLALALARVAQHADRVAAAHEHQAADLRARAVADVDAALTATATLLAVAPGDSWACAQRDRLLDHRLRLTGARAPART